MKWITHQLISAGSAVVLGMPMPGVLAAWGGAIAPDLLDQKRAALGRRRQQVFNRIHRGSSHWFGWWLALWLVGVSGFLPYVAGLVAAGLGWGALTHVALDACTPMGIPVLPWSRQGKFSLRLCRTGGLGEYIFLLAALGLFWVLERHELAELVHRVRLFLPPQ